MSATALAIGMGVAGVVSAGAAIYSGNKQAKAAKDAASAQERAAMAGIASTEASFDKVVNLMAPYREAGYQSLKSQQGMLGLLGPEAQQAELMTGILPRFEMLTGVGENAIRQNASATGGLRGGNIQAALAKFRPELLNSLIEQQYSNLGQITTQGQAAAANQAQAAQAAGSNVAALYGNMGAAQAGGYIGAAQGLSNAAMGAAGAISGSVNQIAGLQTTLGIGRLAKIW